MTVTANFATGIPSTTASVVPALAPYVSVTPATLPAKAAGSQQVFTLRFSAASSTPLGTLEGVLRLKAGTATVARPLPVTLNVWAETRNQHFSFMTPPNAVVSSNDHSALVRKPGADAGDEEPGLVFTIDPNPNNMSFQDYYDGDPGRNLIGQSEGFTQLTVGGVVAYRFIPYITFAGEVVVVIPRDHEFVVVIDDGSTFQTDGSLQAILSTVRF